MNKLNSKKVLLLILDGFGIGENNDSNAIYIANTPNLDKIFKTNPFSKLKASGIDVGLPEGQMGNSEVGHTNMGSGRIVYQDLTYINKCIETGEFYENEDLIDTINYAKKNNSTLHIMGLLSDGGIHSHINHFYATLELAKKLNLKNVGIHIWTDGRDTPPKSAIKYINNLENFVKKINLGKIQTVCGRYYSMDRDKNWDRTNVAFECMAFAKGKIFKSAKEAIENSYQNNITDEFLKPCVIEGFNGIQKNDAVICLNFRPDRARQITRKFTEESSIVKKYCCFSQYDETFANVNIAFKPRKIRNTLGEIVSNNGLSQLRIAETEKYAHVTFFFNGGQEKPYKNEKRIIINSPKVKTYDLKPEMSAYELTDTLIEKMNNENYDFTVINFANPDMVGHTGNFEATVKAIETVDLCIKKILNETQKIENLVTIITADHGNAEKMKDKDGEPFTSHTSNLVPFVILNYNCRIKKEGRLCDIAPTILEILNLPCPPEFTGSSLVL